MTEDDDQTKSKTPEFDFSAFPSNTLFHERRSAVIEGRPLHGPGTTSRISSEPQAGSTGTASPQGTAEEDRSYHIR